jgi:hypothetical protein
MHFQLAYSPPGCREASKEMQDMPVPCQADPHTSADATNEPTLMVVCCMGAGHPRSIPQGRQMILVCMCRNQQVHHVVESNRCGQDQQAIRS